MNDGSFDIDNNISSNIEISASVSGELSGNVNKIKYNANTFIEFPINPEKIKHEDYDKTENGQLINNYKLIVDIEEARNKKLVDPVWESVNFRLNLSNINIPIEISFDKIYNPLATYKCIKYTTGHWEHNKDTNGDSGDSGDSGSNGNKTWVEDITYKYICEINYNSSTINDIDSSNQPNSFAYAKLKTRKLFRYKYV